MSKMTIISKKNPGEKKAVPGPDVVQHQYPPFMEWLGGLVSDMYGNKMVRVLLLILLPLLILAYYPTPIDDYDIWWHLKLGEHYVMNHTLTVNHAIFSWTTADPSWIYGTWLGSAILYVVFQAASGFGLWLLQWAVFICFFLLYLFYLKAIEKAVDINLITGLFLVAVNLNITALYYKPEMFTMLFFAAAVFIYFYCKSTKRNLFYLYPILFLLWVNVHGGFLAGLVFICIVLAGETANYLLFKRTPLDRRLLVSLAIAVPASFLALLANPYGIAYHIGVLKSLISPEYMSYARQVFAYRTMWEFLFPSEYMFRFINAAWICIIFFGVFCWISVYAYYRAKFIDPTVLGVNAVFFFFSMSAARYAPFFPILSFFSILYTSKEIKGMSLNKSFAPVSLAFFVFFAVNVLYNTVCYNDNLSWFGWSIDKEYVVPSRAVEYIKKNKIQPPLFNDYWVGAYMIWAMYPDYKVFIDPRYGPYWKEVGPDYMNFVKDLSPPAIKNFTAKYPFKAAIIAMRDSAVTTAFMATGEWKLLYFDAIAAVIIHQSLIPSLSPAALATDVGTMRFRGLTNPLILERLFAFYVQIGPQYGQEILEIYRRNVNEFNKHKATRIEQMTMDIRQIRAQLLQAASQQQNRPKGR